LYRIGLSISNYADTFGELPKNTYSPDGRPLLSWRVHLLPFLEEDNLYKRFHLDEPWDSPHNFRLLDEMPIVYARPFDRAGRVGRLTYYRGFSSPGAAFERRPGDHLLAPAGSYRPFTFKDFQDGPRNTFLVVEAGDPVEWTKPKDLDASPGRTFPRLGGFGWRASFQAAMGDAFPREFELDTPEDVLRAAVTHSGGETLPPDWVKR
jgi:hypothetical protein